MKKLININTISLAELKALGNNTVVDIHFITNENYDFKKYKQVQQSRSNVTLTVGLTQSPPQAYYKLTKYQASTNTILKLHSKIESTHSPIAEYVILGAKNLLKVLRSRKYYFKA